MESKSSRIVLLPEELMVAIWSIINDPELSGLSVNVSRICRDTIDNGGLDKNSSWSLLIRFVFKSNHPVEDKFPSG